MFETYLIGRLTKEPETRTTPGGKSVCNFDVAHNKKVAGEDRTVYVRVAAWEKLAEICQKYLRKGSMVLVTGEAGAEAFTGKDGKAKGVLRLTANHVEFLADWGKDNPADEMKDIDPADIPF